MTGGGPSGSGAPPSFTQLESRVASSLVTGLRRRKSDLTLSVTFDTWALPGSNR